MSQDNNNPEDMTDMFCSVWVKVEAAEPDNHDEDYDPSLDSYAYTPESTQTSSTPVINVKPEEKTKKKKRYIPREKKIQPSSEILECNDCEYKTTIKRNLSIHMRIHMAPLQCELCDFTFIYKRGLKKHLNDAHNQGFEEVKSFFCDQCDYKTSFKYNLKTHKRRHNVEKDYKCSLCDFTTSYRHNFVKHSRKHQEKEMFKCPRCPFENKFEGYITRHLIQIHKEAIQLANGCKYCGFYNKESWRVRIHQKKSKVDYEISCKLCSFKTFYKCESRLHRRSHFNGEFTIKKFLKEKKVCLINNQEKKLKTNCDWCNFTSKNEIKMVEHIKSNIRDEIIQCNHCEFNTFYACELEMHEKNDHVNNIGNQIDSETPDTAITTSINSTINEQQLLEPSSSQAQNFVSYNEVMYGKKNCSSQNYLIDKTCVSFKSILVLKTNDSEKPFQCTFCGYKSKFKACVQRHFQRHHTSSDTKPYECINCDFAAKTKEQISLHNKRSESNTTIKCSQCDFTSLHKCSLKMHEKIHFEFKCESCTYTCRTKYLLIKHYSTYHLKKDIKCANCDFTEKRNDNVICHETIHTNEKPYRCKFCNYESVKRRVVKEHLKKNHGLGKGFLKSKSYIDPYPPFEGDDVDENESSDAQSVKNELDSETNNIKNISQNKTEQNDTETVQNEIAVEQIHTDQIGHENEQNMNKIENVKTEPNIFESIQNETLHNQRTGIIRNEQHVIMQHNQNISMNTNSNLPVIAQNIHTGSVIVPNNGLKVELEQNYHNIQTVGQNRHNIPTVGQNGSQVLQNYHFRPPVVQNRFANIQNDRNVINEVHCDQLGFINVQNGQNGMNIG